MTESDEAIRAWNEAVEACAIWAEMASDLGVASPAMMKRIIAASIRHLKKRRNNASP